MRKRITFRLVYLPVLALAIFVGGLAAWNAIATAYERSHDAGPGTMVDLGYGKMHVYTAGTGGPNLVILPGWGDPCPTLDFMPLVELLSKDYRVSVVDYFGYGWSDGTLVPRTNANIVREVRAALAGAGIEPPYILVPHSLSGIYALYYAERYPAEVRAVINLDSSVPETNGYVKPQKEPAIDARALLRGTGFIRLAAAFGLNLGGFPLDRYSKADIAAIDRMVARNLDNPTVMAESAATYANRGELVGARYPAGMPVAMVLADSSIEASRLQLGGMDWIAVHKAQLADPSKARVYVLHGPHNIYWDNAGEIARIVAETLR